MGEQKTLRQRVDEEIPNFTRIYASYVAVYESKAKDSGPDDPWSYAFDIPYESEATLYPADPSERHDVVVKTVCEMGLDECRLGGTIIKDDRINKALDFGYLTLEDLAPLYSLPLADQEVHKMGPMIRFKLDRRDPFFWRTLLELFCRAYNSRGPSEWPLAKKIDFALDLHEIWQKKLDLTWRPGRVLEILRNDEPYKSKYPETGRGDKKRAGIGPDRIQDIIDWIGPINEETLERLKAKNEAVYFEVTDKRWAERRWPGREMNSPLTLEEISEILNEVEKLGETKPQRLL